MEHKISFKILTFEHFQADKAGQVEAKAFINGYSTLKLFFKKTTRLLEQPLVQEVLINRKKITDLQKLCVYTSECAELDNVILS